jgi:hypothetical protein
MFTHDKADDQHFRTVFSLGSFEISRSVEVLDSNHPDFDIRWLALFNLRVTAG